jgi:hypothetical protein
LINNIQMPEFEICLSDSSACKVNAPATAKVAIDKML